MKNGLWVTPEQCAKLTLWFAKLSIPDMKYELTFEGIPELKCYGLELPGYGCYIL